MLKVAVITVSDRAARGEYADRSGPRIREILEQKLPGVEVAVIVVPDEAGAITGFTETTHWAEVNAIMIDNSRCIRCGECMRVCPVNCISVTRVELTERMAQGGDHA